MKKHGNIWVLLAVFILITGGCSSLRGTVSFNQEPEPAKTKSESSPPAQMAGSESAANASLKPAEAVKSSETAKPPETAKPVETAKPAVPAAASAPVAVDSAKEIKTPTAPTALLIVENTRKNYVEDNLPMGENETSADDAAKAEPVLMVKPEELEKLGEGAPPLEKPRRVDSDLPVVFNDTVERFIRAYQSRHRPRFFEGLTRMGRYQAYAKKVFKEKGLPEDLIYLGMVESAYNPHVYSRARALGIWQFIPGTGRVYRLRQDFWIDERKDFEKSTEAAAQYLRNLYNRFGDWALALAGYNAGEGRVEWALRRSKSRDYWQLRLPRETKLFVPAIYASVVIGKNLEEYGFKDLQPEAPFDYEKVTISDATDLKIIADCAGVEAQLIHDMNPELLRWCTPPQTDYEVKIPKGTKEKFQEKFSQIPKEQWVSWRTHKVLPGETMAKIAKRYRMTAAALAEMNHLKSVHRIRTGQVLMIPVPWGAPLPHQHPAAPPPSAPPPVVADKDKNEPAQRGGPSPGQGSQDPKPAPSPPPVEIIKTQAQAPANGLEVKPD